MEPESKPQTQRTHARWGFADAALLLVAAGILVAMRSHAFELPLETDECNYAYVGGRLLEGDRLYVDVWDHQPPGIFALFATVIGLSGDGPFVFRWLAVAASLASMVLIYLLGRRTSGRLAAAAGALIFAWISADPGTAGEGVNRELFMNVAALGGLWFLLRRDRPAIWEIAAAGACLGLGSTLKTVMAAQWLLLAVWLGVEAYRRTGTGRFRVTVTHLLVFGAGPTVIWCGVFGYFAATGRFDAFYGAVFEFNLAYCDVDAPYVQRFISFFRRPVHRYVFDSSLALWIAAGMAVVALPIVRWRRGMYWQLALLAYLLGSYIAVCLPGQLWPHYYYLMLPPLVLVFCAACAELIALAPRPSPWQPARVAGVMGLVVVGAALLATQIMTYLAIPTLKLTDLRYDSRDLWGRAQGINVAKVTDPADTVFVYGHDVGVYYYSGRRCASRYTMVRALQEKYPGFEKRRAILMEELKRERPRVILLVEDPFEALGRFLQAHYIPVGLDYHDRREDEVIMAVLADRSRPIKSINWNWHRAGPQETGGARTIQSE